MRPQPLIACRDVEASSRWYQRLLGCKSAHGGPEYERLVDPKRQRSEHASEGLILQLHDWNIARPRPRGRFGCEAVRQRSAPVVRGR